MNNENKEQLSDLFRRTYRVGVIAGIVIGGGFVSLLIVGNEFFSLNPFIGLALAIAISVKTHNELKKWARNNFRLAGFPID